LEGISGKAKETGLFKFRKNQAFEHPDYTKRLEIL
jgi:hypothetical protein